MIKFILKLLGLLPKGAGASVSIPLESGYNATKPVQRVSDQKLSDHFSLFELTTTPNVFAQLANRDLSDMQIDKLAKLARMAEIVRTLCGGPVRIHSGYRCLALNSNTAGSSNTSQHPKCEAIDFDVPGQSVDQSFALLYQAAKAGHLQFGQLIVEEAHRGYEVARWVHCSTIGTLSPEKVGQVMRMVQTPEDPNPVYILVDTLKFDNPVLRNQLK